MKSPTRIFITSYHCEAKNLSDHYHEFQLKFTGRTNNGDGNFHEIIVKFPSAYQMQYICSTIKKILSERINQFTEIEKNIKS